MSERAIVGYLGYRSIIRGDHPGHVGSRYEHVLSPMFEHAIG